jgi:E3 ubiquitin-protein ligase HUWE1
VTERLNKFTNHVILALLPAAVEASKQAKIQEEQEKAIRQEALAKEEAEAAEEKINAEQVAKEEADQAVTQEVADARQVGLASSVVPASEDQAMEDAVPLPAEADSDMTDATTLEPVNAEPHHESTTESPEISGESSSAPTAPPERVTVMIHGSPVDITETGIDPTFLEALPDDMREEVLNQHVRDQRAARIERPPDSQISSEFLDALPPEIRAEIIQQEAVQRAQARPGAGAEMDNATFLASLDPTLRQTVLMEQDEGFIQTLPSHMLAEVGTYREGQQPQRASHRSIPVPGSVASRKFTPQHDAIQLLDKSGVAVLVRLLFFPHVLKKTLLFKVLVNLCENAKTRTELFNLLLNILQDGTGDLAAVDKSFAQMSFRNSKPPTSKALGKQKAGPEYLPGLALPSSQNEAVPDLIAQRCLEALTYIVSSNEMSSLFFLTEHELPAGLRRTASKKGKGKEKQIPQTHYPIVLLLSLLDRQSLLRTPAIMESVVGLLATVTRPLASLKDRKDPVESDASTPNLPAPEPPSGAPESLEAPMDTVSTVETLSASISDSPPAPSEPTPPTAEVPTGLFSFTLKLQQHPHLQTF